MLVRLETVFCLKHKLGVAEIKHSKQAINNKYKSSFFIIVVFDLTLSPSPKEREARQ